MWLKVDTLRNANSDVDAAVGQKVESLSLNQNDELHRLKEKIIREEAKKKELEAKLAVEWRLHGEKKLTSHNNTEQSKENNETSNNYNLVQTMTHLVNLQSAPKPTLDVYMYLLEIR